MEEDKHPISYHLTHPGLALQTLLYSIIHRSREHKTTKRQNGNNKSFTKKLFKLLTKGIMEIADEKLNDKSPGIKQIVQRSLKKNKKPDHMFFFGNSNSDIKGMRVLQELAQKHKYKASTVFVKDPNDSDDPAISHRLSSFKATHDFLRALRNKLPEKIRDNEKTADYTVVSHNIQGNAISLPEHYTDLHYDRLINATRDRLHHNRIHTFQEFNGNDLAKLIEEEPSMNGGYKHINGLHVFWAPDFKQGTPNTLVDFYSDESSGFMHPRDRPREGMQYMVTIAPSKYFTLEADDTELNKNETRSEISPWFRIFKNNPKDSTKNNLIHTMTGWGKQVSPALAIRLRDAKNQAIQIVNFHLPAVMDTTRRINLFKNILRSTALAVGDLATIIAGDFNPLDDMLAFREFCTTRDSARSEEAKLEQVLHDKGFISPFRTKSPTHLDKRTFLKPFVKNLYRALDLIAINKNFKFHDIDEEKVAQKTEQYRCEPRSERKRLRKNLQYPSGVSVGKWHGSDHRKVTALIDKNSDTVTNTEPTETKTYVQRLNADPAKHHILAA
jgi:hypothetical protein